MPLLTMRACHSNSVRVGGTPPGIMKVPATCRHSQEIDAGMPGEKWPRAQEGNEVARNDIARRDRAAVVIGYTLPHANVE